MNMLLDTQALLWFLLDDPRLSNKGREVIMHAEGSIFVSPASFWEIAIKISLGQGPSVIRHNDLPPGFHNIPV